ncbi:MAG: hypothetical protein Q9M97_07685 [Candidatus Gracilibacteria bacterium]|nr:hypothetical protein [Candidatus Gracilibacteria bacterium]
MIIYDFTRILDIKEDFMDALDELNMTEIDRIRDDCLKIGTL